jgi:hypothetical protein
MNCLKLVGLTIMVLLLACTPPSGAVRSSGVDIRGEIKRIRRASSEDEGRFVGTVLVEGDKKANESFDQANLIVTDETRIFERRGDERRRATFEDLKVGDTVEAQFVEGPTVMMYPLQVGAAEIVILNRGAPKE